MLVDTGYYAWKVATQDNEDWSTIPDFLYILDSRVNHRMLVSPTYKANRYRATSDYSQKIWAKVKGFYDFVKEHRQTQERYGYEADDVIALECLKYKLCWVIGEDKDLLQIPSIALMKSNYELQTLEHFRNTKPRWIQPYLQKPDDIRLFLTLMGDVADNVPRLLPSSKGELKKAHQQYGEIYNSKRPFSIGVNAFGQSFIDNLKLVVLPCPLLLSEVGENVDNLVDLLDSGRYNKLWV